VKRILKASARTLGRQVTQKKALLADDLMRLVDQIDINTLRGARDKAMLLLGFAGGFRRSEVVNLCYHDLTFIDHHLHIRLRKSKTDQEQRGLDKPIFGEINSIYCPVQAVKHWLSQSGIKSGHIFRRISKADRINLYKNQALSSVAYVNQLKHYAEQAGLDSSALAGHSLRSGFVTSAAMNGQDVLQIADITKQDIRTVQRYMRKAQQFEQHAGEGLLKSRKN
ncbi:MAG TPA: site-specific integrase, partial [Thiothrix sp.]|nr:site-specific integrase [Thiothrix sp.]